MSKTQELTYEDWSSAFRYEPETGRLFRIRRLGKFPIGEAKGTINNQGYVVISLNGRPTLAHRVAWLLMTKKWPEEQVDHINRVKTDNRWCNLRAASLAQNNGNVIKKKTRDLPIGVRRAKDSNVKPFFAAISVNNKGLYLGSFRTPEEAHAAYLEAKRKYHGDFNPHQ
jgi:hypothetical protein